VSIWVKSDIRDFRVSSSSVVQESAASLGDQFTKLRRAAWPSSWKVKVYSRTSMPRRWNNYWPSSGRDPVIQRNSLTAEEHWRLLSHIYINIVKMHCCYSFSCSYILLYVFIYRTTTVLCEHKLNRTANVLQHFVKYFSTIQKCIH